MSRLKKISRAFTWFLIASGIASCAYHSEEELYGVLEPDTSNVTWEYPIKQILEVNCVYCHNEYVSYKGVRHDTYENELKVVRDGRLEAVINHLPGYTRMPYQRSKLPEQELELLNHWIEIGAPEY